MEQWRAETFGHLGQHGCTVPVDCIGESGVLFGGVDLGIGGSVDDERGAKLFQRPPDPPGVGEVQLSV